MQSFFGAFSSYTFGKADAAAAPGGAILPILGVPDNTDQTTGQIPMPANGAIFGISVETGVAAGDTATFQVSINGTLVGLLLGGSNATPRAASMLGAPIAFNAGDGLGITYATTTGGAYTVNDISCQVLVGFDIPTPVGGRHV
jgi:hypothetical protein